MDQIESIAQNNKKLVVGWFSFTCCEDSTILFTELLNDNFDKWKKAIDFKNINALKSSSPIDAMDVAFVEGALSSESQEKEVKKIRENAKYVVAIGSCAVTGMPSASRNEFADDQINEKIQWYFSHFDYSDKVKKLDEVIEVDDVVDGCPMDVPNFYKALEKYLKVFEIG